MKTREMLETMAGAGYPIKLVAAQSGVSYMRVFRYLRRGGALSPDDKARLWRFAVMQPPIAAALDIEIEEGG
jgi:hypothetical protein